MELDLPLIAFIAFATIAIVSSLMVVFKKSPVSAAFSLILVLFSFAGIYAILGAHLVAAFQVLIYTGAIMVLFVFVIMLLNADSLESDINQTSLLVKGITALGLFSLGTVLIRTILNANEIKPTGPFSPEQIKSMGGNVQVISEALFTDFVFHFELISFLVLGAVIATIALAKRVNKNGRKGATS